MCVYIYIYIYITTFQYTQLWPKSEPWSCSFGGPFPSPWDRGHWLLRSVAWSSALKPGTWSPSEPLMGKPPWGFPGSHPTLLLGKSWLVPTPKYKEKNGQITTGWWFQSLWKISVNWDDYSQYMGKEKMFQTTNQICVCVSISYVHIHICIYISTYTLESDLVALSVA